MKRFDRGTVQALPLPFGVGLMAGGIVVTASSVIGLLADGDEFAAARLLETALGLASIIIGVSLYRLRRKNIAMNRAVAMAMFVATWVGFTAVAIASFWVSQELDSALDAVFEAVSASTTTGFTTVEDPQQLSFALRFLRGAMPWATGLGVLMVSMGVLPVAIAGTELNPERPLRGKNKIVSTSWLALRNILGLYALLTTTLAVAYQLAGMTIFDAAVYALSTASTGGMANHAESIGHFDSTAIEWIAAIGMAAAGGNLLVVWWAIKGRFDSVWKSTELRLYIGLLVAGFLAVYFGGSNLSASESAVAITSMLSTTGLRAANWADGSQFVVAVLLVGAGFGAMSGSLGSGFRLARVARIALEVRRSLQRMLTPTRKGVVRIDGVAVSEDSLKLTFGYLWMHAFTLAGAAVLLYSTNLDLVGTLTFALSLVSNVGVLVDGDQVVSHVELSGYTEIIASFTMLLGRLSIYPVLLTVTGFARWMRRLLPHKHIGARA